MKKIFTVLALVASYSSIAQLIPQATGFDSTSMGISHIDAVNDTVVWAAAYNGAAPLSSNQEFTRTTDGGETWVPGIIDNATGLSIAMIHALSADTAYAVMYPADEGALNQGVYITTDAGLTWTRQASASFGDELSFANVIHFFDSDNGVVIGDPVNNEYEIYTTTDGGNNWIPVPAANIANPIVTEYGVIGYYSAVGDTIWFGTNLGRVYRSTNRGLNWQAYTTSLGATVVDVEFASALRGLAQAKGNEAPGELAETFDGGETWANINANGPTLYNDMKFVPGTTNTYVATGSAENNTGVAFTTDGGHNWNYFYNTEEFQFLATDWINDTTGWVGSFNVSDTVGGMFKFNGLIETVTPPTNLTATVDGQSVVLTWTAPVTESEVLFYRVYKNNELIPTNIEEPTYTDPLLGSSSYTYTVTAVYAIGESAPSNAVEVQISGVTTIMLDFEDQEDFDTTFGEWTTIDGDGGGTYGFEGIDFPGSGMPMSFIAFNPETSTPPVNGMAAHNGDRFGASFASTDVKNNDWLISPKVSLGVLPQFSMWVKTFDPDYIESYNVLVSTTDSLPASFTAIAGPLTAPAQNWEFVTFDLSAFVGQDVYVAVQNVSDDKFIFMVDELTISYGATGIVDKPAAKDLKVYPNPSNGILKITADSELDNVSLVNLAGQEVYISGVVGNTKEINTSKLPSGIYMLKVTSKIGVSTIKVTLY